MNDEELRSLIRAAIQKHLSGGTSDSARSLPDELRRDASLGGGLSPTVPLAFGQYRLERPAGDTSCLIEPAVQCNHCGFCKCHGH